MPTSPRPSRRTGARARPSPTTLKPCGARPGRPPGMRVSASSTRAWETTPRRFSISVTRLSRSPGCRRRAPAPAHSRRDPPPRRACLARAPGRAEVAGLSSGRERPDRFGAIAPALVGLVTLLLFVPALGNGFVNWDDEVNLVSNPHYRGLGWPQLRWMFGNTLGGHYIPVTWLSFGLDYVLWGMRPAGYHATSIALHAANATLFYFVARRLLSVAAGADARSVTLGAVAAALLFSLH